MGDILVLGELEEGRLQSSTHELLALGRSLGGAVAAAIPGHAGRGLDDAAAEAISRGADAVYLVEHPLLGDGSVDAHLSAVEQLCRQTSPSVVLVGRTAIGRELGPRLAFRLGVGLAQDCLDVRNDPDTGRVVASRPVYGGNAVSVVTFPDEDPQVVVVRAKVYEPLEADPGRSGGVESFAADLDPSVVRSKVVETVRQEAEGVRLEDASIVVGGGRGLGGPEPFETLQELADLLGGAMGASRAACDAGWLDHSYQIGLTGKTITPELYITVGISGASQHMAGCSSAKNLVAINKDGEANIFKEARYGVVGDWTKVLPSLMETIRELVKS